MFLTPAQSQIARDTHRFRVINCGRQFGKTTLAVEEIKGLALAKESKIVYIATTIQQARDIAWSMLKHELGPILTRIRESPSHEIEVANLKGSTSLIQVRGWEAVETLRGQQFDLIVLDEVASMRNFWTNWQEVLLPTLVFREGSAMFISTPKGFNHFYDLYATELTDKDFKSFHFTSYDNPHLGRKELEDHKAKSTEDRFAQEYLADFRKTHGLVYKEFDRKRHIYTDTVFNPIERLVGIDWGYTNPAAVYVIERDTDNNFYVSSEYYKTHKTTPELIEYISTLKGNKFYPDPAEPDRLEELRRAGMIPREVSKDIEAGIQSVRELLKTNRLFVHASCVNLISEFETYAYPEKKDEKNEPETPIKENDHAMDAIRYVLHMQAMKVQGTAHVHYAQSALPTLNIPETRRPPAHADSQRVAHTHYPRL